MKIIDAHLHLFPPSPETEETARQVGHHNSTGHLRQVYGCHSGICSCSIGLPLFSATVTATPPVLLPG